MAEVTIKHQVIQALEDMYHVPLQHDSIKLSTIHNALVAEWASDGMSHGKC